jgi:hypothetical protein
MILAALIGLFLLFKVLGFVKELIFPTPPPPPTVSFGKIPESYFQTGIKKNFNYTIDTLSGELPQFEDRANVYEMETPKPDLLAVERASLKVSNLGFDKKPEQLSDILFRWNREEAPQKTLILNVNMASFTLFSSFLTNQNVLSASNLPEEKEAIAISKRFIEFLDVFPETIDENKTKTKLFNIVSGSLVPVQSLSNAKLISVYFYQKDIDEMPIVYPGGTDSSMNLVVGGGQFEGEVVNARFFYQKVTDKSGTYPIISAQEAFEKLKKGEAYIASHEGDDNNVLIKKVYLGLYSEGRQQEYLTPVVVFEGNNNFMAYVPAVMDEWIDRQ